MQMRDEFEAWEARRNLRANSQRSRRRLLNRLERDHDLLAVTEAELAGWLYGQDLSPRSIASYAAQLRTFFRWAQTYGWRADNPAATLEAPRLPRLTPRPIPEADFQRGLAAARGPMRTWLLLAGYAGFRVIEICNQRCEDVGVEFITVTEGKGGHQRRVPLHPLIAAQIADRPESGLLCPGRHGKPLDPSRLSRLISAHFRMVGVCATAHQLRHRFGTRVYEASRDLLVTQRVLGHASPATTAGYVATGEYAAVGAVNSI